MAGHWFHSPELRPDQVNEKNQIIDRHILNRDRFKFGVGCIMYQSEETGLSPIHTVIVRALGGSHVHIGIVGAISGIGSLVQWIGALLLRRFGSSRKAMTAALCGGVVFGYLLCLILLLAASPQLRPWCLIAYLACALSLAGASGVQGNVETSWIGDMVPQSMMGWFTSVKWLVAAVGVLTFVLLFGWAADWGRAHPEQELMVYAALFTLVGTSHVVAILLMNTVTDRVPKSANFFSAADGSRLNYRAMPLWSYILFYVLWSGGRGALLCFATAYLLDQFNFSMTKVVSILAIQNVVSVVILLIMGKVTDKFGTRVPLMLVSLGVGACMLLWVSSAWWGIVPIIVYQFVNGAAGNTHSMLAINYGQEIFPTKGRAGYFGFSRIFIGITAMAGSVIAGLFMTLVGDWHCELWGATLNNYHLFFGICALLTMSCALPLLLIGNRKVREI